MNPILLLTLTTATVVPAPAEPTQAQNVLMIVIDDIGSENLSWWPQANTASNPAPTPNMQAMAQAGVVFSKFYTQTLCSPTRAALLSGRYAFDQGMGSNPEDLESLSTSLDSIPDILKATTSPTYACGAFGKWHLGAVGNWRHPIHTGFDLFDGTEANVYHPTSSPTSDHYNWWNVKATAASATRTPIPPVPGAPNDENNYSLSVTGAAARQWISQQTGPYFAYVCLNVPHGPQQVPPHSMLSATTLLNLPAVFVPGYEAPAGNLAQRKMIYRLAIEALDTEIGRLLAAADHSNTTILVVGDNGTPATVADPKWVREGKDTVYDAGTRVPLIVQGPMVQFPGTECTQLVSVVDILPTIVALASGSMPVGGPPAPGMDFTSLIADSTSTWGRKTAFCQAFEPNGGYAVNPGIPAPKLAHDRGITDGTIHYLRKDFDPLTGFYVEEAYDLSVDPMEDNDLLSAFPFPAPTAAQSTAIAALRAEMTTLSGP